MQSPGFTTRSDTKRSVHSHKNARNFGFKRKKNCTTCVAKTKVLISFAVTVKLICAFVFAKIQFSHDAAQIHSFESHCMVFNKGFNKTTENWILHEFFPVSYDSLHP